MRSRYFVRLEYFSTPCICMILLKKDQKFFHAFYICMILLKVVVCFGVFLSSEVGNVVLHALPKPYAVVDVRCRCLQALPMLSDVAVRIDI